MAKKSQLKERTTNELLYPITVKDAVHGIENVDNTSDANKPVSTAQATAIADAKKAGMDAQTALNNHKLSDKHIPSGGHSNQVLAWQSDGTAKWADMPNMFSGFGELISYGVVLDDSSSNTTLTRIGNAELHRTLPIHSQIKGCIAQGNQVIYWLNPNDWRFRESPIYMDVDLSNNVESPNFQGASIAELGVGQYVKAGTHVGKIASIEGSNVTIKWEENLSDISAELVGTTKLEIGSRLDGYHGTVRNYCPSFYYQIGHYNGKHRVLISPMQFSNDCQFQPECLIDAFKCTVLNESGASLVSSGKIPSTSYLATLPANSLISVVNNNTYCRGGDITNTTTTAENATYDSKLSLTNGEFLTMLGKPICMGKSELKTFVEQNVTGVNKPISYEVYKNIFYWLYVIEYANLNCQESYNADFTDNGYKQGGLSNGITFTKKTGSGETISGILSGAQHLLHRALIPCGYLNKYGNRNISVQIPLQPTADYNAIYATRWRGFDDIFGDISTLLTDTSITYTATAESTKYEANITVGDRNIEAFEATINGTGLIENFAPTDHADIFPIKSGGSVTASYTCDGFNFTPETNINSNLISVGGDKNLSNWCGIGCIDASLNYKAGIRTMSFNVIKS